MSPKLPKLCVGVGAVASVMSNIFYPINPIHNNYSTRPKNHKLQVLVLVEVEVEVVRQDANAILVFVFTHFDFPYQEFYSSKQYNHMTKTVRRTAYSYYQRLSSPLPSLEA